MQFTEKVYEMAKALDSRKAEDIILIDVRETTIIADYFIVASGRSTQQVKTLADELDAAMERIGEHKLRIEGYNAARWIVLDYGDVLIHLFHEEERRFYDIERLWQTPNNSEVYAPDENR